MLINKCYRELFNNFQEDIEQVKEQVLNARRRNVLVRVMTGRAIKLKDGELNLLDEFSKVTSDLQVFPLPQARNLTMDDKETLMGFAMTKKWYPPAREYNSYLDCE